jgi:serine/threonine-protein phosphatase 2B regulatory subunit
VDGDGWISEGDLRKLLGLLAGKALSPNAVAAVVARTLADADADRDGRISFEDFVQVRALPGALLAWAGA